MRDTRLLRGFLPFLAALAGCAPLSTTIQENVCGNGVIEPDNKEECDTTDESKCRPPTDDDAPCTVICDASADATGCAAGAVCGADGRCRVPKSTFRSVLDLPAGYARVTAADFDGDGVKDLVGSSIDGARVDIDLLDEDGELSDQKVLPGTHANFHPIAMEISKGSEDEDVHPDLVFRGGDLLGVVEGNEDATFPNRIITQVSSLQLPPMITPEMIKDAVFFPLTFPLTADGTTTIGFQKLAGAFSADVASQKFLFVVAEGQIFQPIAWDPGVTGPELQLKAVAIDLFAPVGETAPCDEIVVGAVGATKVHVLDICSNQGMPTLQTFSVDPSVPSVTMQGSLLPFELGGDGGEKGVVIPRAENEPVKIHYDPFFGYSLSVFATGTPNVLGVGDFDGDGTLDMVDSAGIALCPDSPANGPGGCTTYLQAFGSGPSKVFPVDLQKDGQLDLVTVQGGSPTVYRNLGTGFAVENVASDEAVEDVLVADFDGDTYPDLLTATAAAPNASLSHFVNDGEGAFHPAVSIGSVPPIDHWTAADVAGNDGVLDALVLGVAMGPPPVSALAGSPTGLFSPFPFGNDARPLAAAEASLIGEIEKGSGNVPDLAALIHYDAKSQFKPMACAGPMGGNPTACLVVQIVPVVTDEMAKTTGPALTTYPVVLESMGLPGGIPAGLGADPAARLVTVPSTAEGQQDLVAIVPMLQSGEPAPNTPPDPSLYRTSIYLVTGGDQPSGALLHDLPSTLVMDAVWATPAGSPSLVMLVKFDADETRVCMFPDAASIALDPSLEACKHKVASDAFALGFYDVDFDGQDEVLVTGPGGVEYFSGTVSGVLEDVQPGTTIWTGDLDGDNIADIVTSSRKGHTFVHFGGGDFTFTFE